MLPVKARKSAKKDPDRYLIIGFDSEYQLVVTGDNARLENEVLSYQFSCVIVERVAGGAPGRQRLDHHTQAPKATASHTPTIRTAPARLTGLWPWVVRGPPSDTGLSLCGRLCKNPARNGPPRNWRAWCKR